jgi:hypothetical protein
MIHFRAAIDMWEGVLKEAGLSSRKARINEKVARHLQHNIGLVAVWAKDFELATTRLTEASERRQLRSEVNMVLLQYARSAQKRLERHLAAVAAGPAVPTRLSRRS